MTKPRRKRCCYCDKLRFDCVKATHTQDNQTKKWEPEKMNYTYICPDCNEYKGEE